MENKQTKTYIPIEIDKSFELVHNRIYKLYLSYRDLPETERLAIDVR